MLDKETRIAILKLHKEGYGKKRIARILDISKNSVRKVIKNPVGDVPQLERKRKVEVDMVKLKVLHRECKGNIVRVQEELEKEGARISYSTLTKLCRDFNISGQEIVPARRIETAPGVEMQHDTSIYMIKLADKIKRRVCALLVLGYSRLMYVQFYPCFTRFHCKVFLSEGFEYFRGVAKRCIIDNTHVVILRGTGRNAIICPEMEAFEKRFGFEFVAHEVRHSDRKGKVERGFSYIERNFLAGRRFKDDKDLNRQALVWLERANTRYMRRINGTPREYYVTEYPYLIELPPYIPEVYRIHQRTVDIEGFVTLHRNRYSVPARFIGRLLTLRETKDSVIVLEGHKEIALHERLPEGAKGKRTLKEHEVKRRDKRRGLKEIDEEIKLKSVSEEVSSFISDLKKSTRSRYIYAVKELYRLYIDYRLEDFINAVRRAHKYGLYDIRRVEKIILKSMAKNWFELKESIAAELENLPGYEIGKVSPESDLKIYDEHIENEEEDLEKDKEDEETEK